MSGNATGGTERCPECGHTLSEYDDGYKKCWGCNKTIETETGGTGRSEELKTRWENEAHHLKKQGHDEPPALKWHVWVARYDDENRKDFLVFGDSDDLESHAPAIAHSRIADVEHFGTFADFAGKRQTIELDLPETISAPGELTGGVGRGTFWSVVWGDFE